MALTKQHLSTIRGLLEMELETLKESLAQQHGEGDGGLEESIEDVQSALTAVLAEEYP